MFTGGLKLLVGLIGVLWLALAGAGGMYWWDHRQTHFPVFNWHGPILGQPHIHWTAPESLKARLDAASRDLHQCQLNEFALNSAISRQNDAVEALHRAGDRMAANAQKAVSEARSGVDRASRVQAQIQSFKPAGDSVCERAGDVDRKFLGSL